MEYIGTTSQEELMISTIAGIDESYVDWINETEKYVISRSRQRESYMEKGMYKAIFDEPFPQFEEREAVPSSNNNNVIILKEFPKDKHAVVIAGGSYNRTDVNGNYVSSVVSEKDEEILNCVVSSLSPDNSIFVIGGKVEGQEKRLLELVGEENQRRMKDGIEKFQVILVTEEFRKLSEEQQQLLERFGVQVIESGEKTSEANYKKINSEIFSQDVQADLIVLDGGQAAANLMTDANKGKENNIISKENLNEFLKDKLALISATVLHSQEGTTMKEFFINSIRNKNLVGKRTIDAVDKEGKERLQENDKEKNKGVGLDD